SVLSGWIGDDELRHAGDFVDLLGERDALLQILEVHGAGKFGEDGERIRVPFEQDLIGLHRFAVSDGDVGAVNHRVAFFFTLFVVHDGNDAVAVHGDDLTLLVLYPLGVDVFGETVGLGILLRLFGDSCGRTADVEGTPGELGAGFADGLRGEDADSFTAFDEAPGGEIASVAGDANTALRFAGEHGADFHALDTGCLNGRGELFSDFLIYRNNGVAFIIALI